MKWCDFFSQKWVFFRNERREVCSQKRGIIPIKMYDFTLRTEEVSRKEMCKIFTHEEEVRFRRVYLLLAHDPTHLRKWKNNFALCLQYRFYSRRDRFPLSEMREKNEVRSLPLQSYLYCSNSILKMWRVSFKGLRGSYLTKRSSSSRFILTSRSVV